MVAAEGTPAPPAVHRWERGVVPGRAEPISSTSDDHQGSEPDVDDGSLFERIVDALEQRVMDELDRRGLRGMPGVF